MNDTLAVFTPNFGLRSETFIRRHIEDLLPGKTVVITRSVTEGGNDGQWAADCPMLNLHGLEWTLEGLTRRAMRKANIPAADLTTKAVERFLKKHRVKVILGEFLDQSLSWLPVAQKLGIRFFGHAHGYDVSRRLREEKWQKEYLRYNQSNGIISVSHACRNRLIDLGLTGSRIFTIPCGVDVPQDSQSRFSREKVRCLAVGRMVAKKAPIVTLDAFRRAHMVSPNLVLDYVGTGELFAAAQQFVQVFGLAKNITLHKGQSHEFVQRLMAEADIFIQHSMTDPETGDEEGLPVAILEAMARNLPVVSTLHAGIPESVIDCVTGYLVNEGDSIAMAERILALARNFDLRQKMGIAGRQRVKELFTWEKERSALLRVMGLENLV